MAFKQFLEEGYPDIKGDSFERVALSAQELKGYKRCLSRIEEASETELSEGTAKLHWVTDEK